MIFHGFLLVSMVFQGGFMVLWFLVCFHGFSGWFHSFSWVFIGFHGFSRWFHGFYGLWLVSMVLLVENTPQNYILAQRSSLGLAGRRPALA